MRRASPRFTPFVPLASSLSLMLASTVAGSADHAAVVAPAATITVKNCNDSGAGSLRAALAGALSGDNIDMRDLGCRKINLTSGAIVIPQFNLTLLGGGITIDAHHTSQVFRHEGPGWLRVQEMRIARGRYQHKLQCMGRLHLLGGQRRTAAYGGALVHRRKDRPGVGHCRRRRHLRQNPDQSVRQRHRGQPGGRGQRERRRCLWHEGGPYRDACPIYAAVFLAGGSDGPVQLESTIASNNGCLGNPFADIGKWTSERNLIVVGGNNLVMDSVGLQMPRDTIYADPLLARLADNGGPTMTHALPGGSPALNKGNNVAGLDYDQRGDGYRRVKRLRADIGAYER